MARQAVVVAVAGVALAAGLFTVHVVRVAPDFSFSGASPGGAIVLLVTGWALVAAGLTFSARPGGSRFGRLLVGAGIAWFLLEWTNPQIGSAVAFTIGLCLYSACPALVGHAVLSYPGGRLASRLERVAVVAAYAGAVLLLGLLPALVYDPRAEGCSVCPRNLLLVRDHAEAFGDLRRAGLYAGVVWAITLAALALVKLVDATRAGWGPSSPVFAAGAAYLGLVAATFAASLGRGLLWNGTLERRLWIGEAVALVGMVAALGWGLLRVRRARTTVARLVVELGKSPPPGGLRDILAGIVGDPDLTVAYPVGESGGLVDAHGRAVETRAHAELTSLVRDGRRVAVLAHEPGLLKDEQLAEEVTAAARLALENERLQAEVAVRIEELRTSRSRIVAAGDAERIRLERNLHDGAQQRLVALSLSLRLLRSQLARDADPRALEALDAADAELDEAIRQLRELAHGIFPSVLADGGLSVAVHALAEDGPVPMTVQDLPDGRFPPTVETAGYAVVAEAARTATQGIVVRGRRDGDALVLEIETDDVRDLDRQTLEDRLGAIDGRLRVAHRARGGVTIRAELPCES
jgi:signal transduction histidine kinase